MRKSDKEKPGFKNWYSYPSPTDSPFIGRDRGNSQLMWKMQRAEKSRDLGLFATMEAKGYPGEQRAIYSLHRT